MRYVLCLNCLEEGAAGVDVGKEKGNQYDNWREKIDLCTPCEEALLIGDFATLRERYTQERTIKVERNESTRT